MWKGFCKLDKIISKIQKYRSKNHRSPTRYYTAAYNLNGGGTGNPETPEQSLVPWGDQINLCLINHDKWMKE